MNTVDLIKLRQKVYYLFVLNAFLTTNRNQVSRRVTFEEVHVCSVCVHVLTPALAQSSCWDKRTRGATIDNDVFDKRKVLMIFPFDGWGYFTHICISIHHPGIYHYGVAARSIPIATKVTTIPEVHYIKKTQILNYTDTKTVIRQIKKTNKQIQTHLALTGLRTLKYSLHD